MNPRIKANKPSTPHHSLGTRVSSLTTRSSFNKMVLVIQQLLTPTSLTTSTPSHRVSITGLKETSIRPLLHSQWCPPCLWEMLNWDIRMLTMVPPYWVKLPISAPRTFLIMEVKSMTTSVMLSEVKGDSGVPNVERIALSTTLRFNPQWIWAIWMRSWKRATMLTLPALIVSLLLLQTW